MLGVSLDLNPQALYFLLLCLIACLHFLVKQGVQDVAWCCCIAFELMQVSQILLHSFCWKAKSGIGTKLWVNKILGRKIMDLRFILCICDNLLLWTIVLIPMQTSESVSVYHVISSLSWYVCTYHKRPQWPNCPSIWQNQTVFRNL